MNTVKKHTNRYGDVYWFEPLGDGRYKFVMNSGMDDWLKWCRFGGKEGQQSINMNDLGMFDPSGGPYVTIGTTLSFGVVTRIEAGDDGVVVTVGLPKQTMKEQT